ncbi:MAG: PspC domain-containing protein, partial [Paludibacter sp.]|nr:PspC domain-containing protein [Paludibacter sp.]
MKKTLTINLNNTVYHIDNDAYELLKQYLNEVEERLSPDEKQEVMADIESRISELFSEKLQKGKNVINIQDVEEVINILGKPNQFSEEEEETEKETKSSTRTEGGKFRKKFYRDPDNAVIGGVAAGLAAFIGWDVVLVRVLLILILLLGWGTIIPIYLVVWLIVPPARTISQKLEMQGEDVTAERIKSEINNLKNYVESDKFKESATGVGNKLGEVIRAILKVLLGFIGAIMGFVGFILLGVLLLLLSFLIFEPSIFTGFVPDLNIFSPDRAVLIVISLLLIVGIPIFMLIYWAIKIITGKRE